MRSSWANGQRGYVTRPLPLSSSVLSEPSRNAPAGSQSPAESGAALRPQRNRPWHKQQWHPDWDHMEGRILMAGPGSFQFASNVFSDVESRPALTFTISREGGSTGAVTVSYAAINGSATAGQDFVPTAGDLTFADGVTEQTVSIPLINDTLDEPTESFTLALSNPTNGATLGVNGSLQIYLFDDDPAPSPGVLSFTTSAVELLEGGQLALDVVRTDGSAGQVAIDYRFESESTAVQPGVDFPASGGTLIFADGQTRQTLIVNLPQDTVPESVEEFFAVLENPANGAKAGQITRARVKVFDDDPLQLPGNLGFSVTSADVNEAQGSVTLSVLRVNGNTGTVNVNFAAVDGTALAGIDYQPISGTLTFSPNDLTQNITIPIINDAFGENPETFRIVLSNPTNGATLNNLNTATITIADDDPIPKDQLTFEINTLSLAEGESRSLVIRRSGLMLDSVSVLVQDVAGTALRDLDYAPVSTRLTFGPSESSKTILLNTFTDNTVESSENFGIQLSQVTGNAELGNPSSVSVTITEPIDTRPTTLGLDQGSISVSEGAGTVSIPVRRTGNPTSAVSVGYQLLSNTAAAGRDFTAVSGRLNFAPGQLLQTLTVPILQDTVYEGNESFQIVLSSPQGGAVLGPLSAGAVTIVDDDPLPRGSFNVSAPIFTVGESQTGVSINVTRDGGSNGPATVRFTTANGTATAGADYDAASGILNFPQYTTSQTVTIRLRPDTVYEGDETFQFVLSNPTNGAGLGAQSQATVTIREDDPAPRAGTFQFLSAGVVVNESASAAIFTVERTNGTDGAVSVQFATRNNTAQGGLDFDAIGGTLNFAPGETRKTLSVPIRNDTSFEPSETFDVVLSNPTGGAVLGGISTATATILDNDLPQPGVFQFSRPVYQVREDAGVLEITVDRINGDSGLATVVYSVSGGTAQSGLDYTNAGGVLNFPAGVTRQTLTIPIVQDDLPESTETFILTLSNATGGAAVGSPASTEVSILDDEPPLPRGVLQLTALAYEGGEGDGAVTVSVARLDGSEGAVTVRYATQDGSALAGQDYASTQGLLTFGPGVTLQSIHIPILQDRTVDELGEFFRIMLSDPQGGALLGGITTSRVTILDDDAAIRGLFRFQASEQSVNENAGVAFVDILRDTGSDGTVGITVTTQDLTATANADYAPIQQTLTFLPGETKKTIAVPILDDTLSEGPETLRITLSAPTGGAGLGETPTAVLTIRDNDPITPGRFQFTSSTFTVSEASTSMDVVIQRLDGAYGETQVYYSTRNDTARAGEDFRHSFGFLTFKPGETSKTVSIPLLPDTVYEGPDETFFIQLSGPTGGATLGSKSFATITITEDDPNPNPAPTPTPTPAPATVNVNVKAADAARTPILLPGATPQVVVSDNLIATALNSLYPPAGVSTSSKAVVRPNANVGTNIKTNTSPARRVLGQYRPATAASTNATAIAKLSPIAVDHLLTRPRRV